MEYQIATVWILLGLCVWVYFAVDEYLNGNHHDEVIRFKFFIAAIMLWPVLVCMEIYINYRVHKWMKSRGYR